LIEISISREFDELNLLNIFNLGYYDYYKKLEILAEGSDTFKNIVENIKYIIQNNKSIKLQKNIKIKKRLELYQKQNIAFNKFQTSNLYSLTNNELKIINKEYKNLQDKSKNPEEYKLVYELYSLFEQNNSSAIKKQLEIIRKQLNIKNYNRKNFIKNKKSQNIICPHNIDKAEIILQNKKDIIVLNEEIISKLTKLYGINKNSTIYCKICGEKIYVRSENELTFSSKENYSNKNDYDELYSYIYKECIYIVSNYIQFSGNLVKNIIEIIKNITSIIKPEIYTIQSSLYKIKTINSVNIKNILNIYTNIYIFASLAQLIYTNQNEISFKEIHGLRLKSVQGGELYNKKTKPDTPDKSDKSKNVVEKKLKSKINRGNKNALHFIINDALNIVKKIKYFEIKRSDNISIDSIKPLFIKAYKWILNAKYVDVKLVEYRYFIQNNIINYFIQGYNLYLYSKGNPNNAINKIEFNDVHRNNHIRKFKDIFGRTYNKIEQDIESNISIFDTLICPKDWSKTERQKYKYESLIMVYNYIIKEIFREHIDENNTILNKFYDTYKHLKELDKKYKLKFQKSHLKPYISYYYNPTIYNIKKVPPKCSCKNKTYHYKNVNNKNEFIGKKISLKIDDIKNWLQTNNEKKIKEFSKMKLFEVECNCITKNDKDEELIISFYNLFQLKCPVDNTIHNFVNSKCKKCEITNDIIKTKDKKYFTKYLSKYDKVKKDKKIYIEKTLEQIKQRAISNKKTEYVIKLKDKIKWNINNKKILELSKLINVGFNELINIGLYEKNEFCDIKTKKKNFHLDEHSNMMLIKRRNNIFNYYLYIIRNYYILKNSEFLLETPVYLKQFLKSYSNKGFYKKLPNINKDFIKKYDLYKKNLNLQEVNNFLLHSISDTLLNIYKILEKINKKMATEYIKIIITKILEFEKQLTYFEVKKYKMNEEQNIDDSKMEDFDSQNIMDIDEKISEDLDDINTIEDVEGDIFSMENVDVEMDAEDNIFTDLND